MMHWKRIVALLEKIIIIFLFLGYYLFTIFGYNYDSYFIFCYVLFILIFLFEFILICLSSKHLNYENQSEVIDISLSSKELDYNDSKVIDWFKLQHKTFFASLILFLTFIILDNFSSGSSEQGALPALVLLFIIIFGILIYLIISHIRFINFNKLNKYVLGLLYFIIISSALLFSNIPGSVMQKTPIYSSISAIKLIYDPCRITNDFHCPGFINSFESGKTSKICSNRFRFKNECYGTAMMYFGNVSKPNCKQVFLSENLCEHFNKTWPDVYTSSDYSKCIIKEFQCTHDYDKVQGIFCERYSNFCPDYNYNPGCEGISDFYSLCEVSIYKDRCWAFAFKCTSNSSYCDKINNSDYRGSICEDKLLTYSCVKDESSPNSKKQNCEII